MARCVFSRSRRAEKDDVVFGLDEVGRTEVRHDLFANRALIGEVEVLERFVRRKARRLDAALAAVRLAAGNLTFQTRGQV
jgi:hypothetical protein